MTPNLGPETLGVARDLVRRGLTADALHGYRIGQNLGWRRWMDLAFELTSALLIVAAVGAMVLAHVEREGPKRTQKSFARERIRTGRPQPRPTATQSSP